MNIGESYTKQIEEKGTHIRGDNGIDVFPRDTGFFIEHFYLRSRGDAVVMCRIGPFESIEAANPVLIAYRQRWGPK